MVIVSQNAGKQGFFVISGRFSRKKAQNDKIIDEFSVFSVSSVAQKIGEICEICGGILLNTLRSTTVESSLQIDLFMQNKANFQKSQVNVRPLVIMNYERKSDWTLGENEPNSKPNKANLHFTAENAEYAEKKDISVSDCSIEKYALYPISPCSLRTWRLTPTPLRTTRGGVNGKQSQFKPKQSQFSNRGGF